MTAGGTEHDDSSIGEMETGDSSIGETETGDSSIGATPTRGSLEGGDGFEEPLFGHFGDRQGEAIDPGESGGVVPQ